MCYSKLHSQTVFSTLLPQYVHADERAILNLHKYSLKYAYPDLGQDKDLSKLEFLQKTYQIASAFCNDLHKK